MIYAVRYWDRRLPGPIKSLKGFITVTAAQGSIQSTFTTLHYYLMLSSCYQRLKYLIFCDVYSSLYVWINIIY